MIPRVVLALLAVLCLASTGMAALDLAAALGRPVARIEIENSSRVTDGEIRRLFLLSPGDRYEPAVVQRSLALLGEKVGIRNIIVRGDEEEGGLVIRLQVVPEPLIRSIGFSGNRSIKAKELSVRLRTTVDRPVLQALLDADGKTIRDVYAQEGFPRAQVTPRVEPGSSPLWRRVIFSIREGTPNRITRVELGQGGETERGRILALLGLDEGSRASQRRLRDGVKEVLKVYRGEGYAQARLEGKARFQPEPSGTALVVPLILGEPVDVRFEGIDEWPARSLRDVARGYFGEVVDGEWVGRVAGAMVERLRSDGYLRAKVTGGITRKDDRLRVTFRVATGPLVRVERVVFRGNASVPAGRLKGYMSVVEGGLFRSPPFTRGALDRDLQVLRELYASKGFLDARVESEAVEISPSGGATVRLRVDEGELYRYGEVVFAGSEAISPARARSITRVSPGEIADAGAVEKGRVHLVAELNGKGYPDAKVEYVAHEHPMKATLDVTYHIEPGPLVRIGKVVVSGNARTRTDVIRRELSFHEGDLWSQQEVLVSRQRLFRLGFFQKVSIEPMASDPGSNRRDVLVEVVEQNAGSVVFGVGYGTEEGPKGYFEVGHANLQGAGRDVRFRVDADRNDRNYSLSFREPWLFGFHDDLGLRLLRQDLSTDSYDLRSYAFQANLERKITGRFRASVLYSLEANHLSDVTDTTAVEGINNYVLSSIGPVLAWDSRDDPFNPRSGFQHVVQAEWALRALGSDVQYGRYQGFTSGFFTWKDLTLALLARGGIAENLGSAPDLPINKRFFLGGRTTVRGFEKDEVGPKDPVTGDPIGGDTMLNLRSELRFPIWKHLGGVLFWDAGNVWNRRQKPVRWLDLRQGAGGGIRYITPIGPISFDLGFKVDRRDGESPQVWNFTIGNVF